MKIDPIAILGSNIREQVENYLDELPPLMMWGSFIFQLSTLAYSKLTIQDTWSWVSQGLIGKRDKLQYTGKKAPTIKFDCEMYDSFINPSLLTKSIEKYGMVNALSVDPVEHLRLQGNLQQPFMLVTGSGKVMGYWVLTDINQTMDSFRTSSEARHQVITLTLQFYGYRLNIDEPVSTTIPLGGITKEQKIQDALKKMRDVIAGVG
ncbi:phage tail protein [Buttiauxella sp. 3AFRM03]|uniref:phage tail protein n=1 Tax=Buttiauxella sp. 3AFRM03 TaxID=2479367 RepID=UPI000EF7C0DC|nr:phage tail protein [Buttiauxella sp. 3AFRM03]AYN30005.1 phage tail protein [Buttiauxella sp. 3AFRM03]